MSKIPLASKAPGIVGLFKTYPVIAHAMSQLAQTLLVGTQPKVALPRWVREYIAASCSQKGQCEFCENSHFAVALSCSPVESMSEMHSLFMSDKRLLALEHYAHLVYSRAGTLTQHDVDQVYGTGATYEEIHLVTAIAAAFKMYNAYVKALGNPGIVSTEGYLAMGQELAAKGYMLY